MMSAVVYDAGYDTKVIRRGKIYSYCAAFVCYERKKTSQDRSQKNIKISKHTAIFKL